MPNNSTPQESVHENVVACLKDRNEMIRLFEIFSLVALHLRNVFGRYDLQVVHPINCRHLSSNEKQLLLDWWEFWLCLTSVRRPVAFSQMAAQTDLARWNGAAVRYILRSVKVFMCRGP